MKIFWIAKSIKLNRSGFTLIELMVAMAITAIIGSTIVISISQIVGVSEGTKNHSAATTQVENSLVYINRDIQVANTITPDPSSDLGFPLTLIWKTWDNKTCKVIYSLESGNLVRSYFENDLNNPQRVETIGHSIDSSSADQTKCTYTNGYFTLKLTATAGSFRPASASRTLNVSPRSSHFNN